MLANEMDKEIGEKRTAQETRAGRPSPKRSGSALGALIRQRNFRLLWIGEGVSLLGDQFYLIAMPWLVLQLTGSALAMGTVLALAGIPRALFMLVGGALTDRFSPRSVMLASNLIRMILVGLLAVLVLDGEVALWMLYAFALLFGLGDAFFYPAQTAIVPKLVKNQGLQSANALMQGTMQVSLFAGPALAGAIIALLGSAQAPDISPVNNLGIGLAFGFDALTFLISALTLRLMRVPSSVGSNQLQSDENSLIASIREGLSVVWNDAALRAFFVMIALANLLVNGPISVGIPVLADTRFPEGAAAFGILMSAFGGGSLLGTLLAGALPRPPARSMGVVLGVIWSGLGLGILALGLIASTPLAALVTGLMGVADGYVVILFITWLQRRTPEALLGRMMSLLMFASAGLLPLSNLLTGALINLNVAAVFVGGGGLMALVVFIFLLNPSVRAMEPAPVPAPGAAD